MSRKTSSNSKGRIVLIHDLAVNSPLYVPPPIYYCLDPTQSPRFSSDPSLLHDPAPGGSRPYLCGD